MDELLEPSSGSKKTSNSRKSACMISFHEEIVAVARIYSPVAPLLYDKILLPCDFRNSSTASVPFGFDVYSAQMRGRNEIMVTS